jgi:hypothetical protein
MPSNTDINPASRKSEVAYSPTPVRRDEHAEGAFTRVIEQQTAKIPSDAFLFAALGVMGVSLYLYLKGRHDDSRFIGTWAPSLLIMGVYNKLVKVLGPL